MVCFPGYIKPSESFTILPQLPRNKVFFRLYSSFTNVGSKRQIQKFIERTRRESGLSESGETQQEIKRKETEAMQPIKKLPLRKRIYRKCIRAIILLVLLVVAFAIGSNVQTHTVEENIVEILNVETEKQMHEWPSFNGIASTKPMFNGRVAKVGDQLGNHGKIRFISNDGRSVVLVANLGYWLWRYGEKDPQPVGTIERIQAAHQRMVDADEEGASPSIPDVPARVIEGVESGHGEHDGPANADREPDDDGGVRGRSIDHAARGAD